MDLSSNIGSALSSELRCSASTPLGLGGATPRVLVSAVVAMATIDWIWSSEIALNVVGWTHVATAISLLVCLQLMYSTIRSVPRLAEAALYSALWVAFSSVGCVLTYLAASISRPFADQTFSLIDASIGFQWVAWADFIHAQSVLSAILRATYGSLMPQIIGSIALFSLVRIKGRNSELLTSAIIGLAATSILSSLLPALGPWVHFDYPVRHAADLTYVADVLAVRGGGPVTFTLTQMQGIVCFPSYHTVLAILLVYAHRGIRWSFPPVLVVNGLMLLSIPSEGGHYLADMIGGAAVAFGALHITSHVRPIFPSSPTSIGEQSSPLARFYSQVVGRLRILKPFHNR
jgi:hypothetical protein